MTGGIVQYVAFVLKIVEFPVFVVYVTFTYVVLYSDVCWWKKKKNNEQPLKYLT